MEVDLMPVPLAGEAAGTSSRFYGVHAALLGAPAFEAMMRIPIQGTVFRTVFQVEPGARKELFVCPMGCEKDKVYYAPGKCPVCKMDLIHPTEAHADHAAKRGGQFFMAPDRWHHLEGVMPSAKEFRVYFYNNFTKPISAKPLVEGSYLEVVNLDPEKRELGKPVRVPLTTSEEESCLKGSMPEGLRFPMSVTARIKFEGKEKPDRFDFTFEQAREPEQRK